MTQIPVHSALIDGVPDVILISLAEISILDYPDTPDSDNADVGNQYRNSVALASFYLPLFLTTFIDEKLVG